MPREKRKDPPRGEVIVQKSMEHVLHDSMIPYSEYVILERALPRVEDGLKPVQRRILYTMMELGITPDKPHKKCARITGDCMGKYHPHGDVSVYDALARMAQDFVMRGMLVDGHGNFGSIDGDSPAAMRYTEARLTPLAMELLRDIEKDTVSFRLNFDDTRKEPDMLPGAFPNLLVNGASGIAVGLATNIPPHNLGETIDATIAQIKNPQITTQQLLQILPAPDFPTGGELLFDQQEILSAYETGRGKLQVRAKTHIESGSAGRSLIVITEMPYQVNKAAMLEKILRLSEEKRALFSGIYDIRDESDRTGLRAVIELRKDADPQKVLSALYKYSDMQVTFGVNMVAIAGGKPVQMGLKAALSYYIAHRKNVVTRRTRFDLAQAQARAHVLEGLIIAVDNLDAIIALIRASKNPKEARIGLMAQFALSEIQAQAILDMRLQRLTGLEILTLREEYAQVMKKITKLNAILQSDKKLMNLICDELIAVRDAFATPRRTRPVTVSALAQQEAPEETAAPEEVFLYETQAGFFKRVPCRLAQKAIEEEPLPPVRTIQSMTDHKLLLFTSHGNAFSLSPEQIPECKPKDRGLAPAGLLAGLESGETVVSVIDGAPEDFSGELVIVTSSGLIKKSSFSEYDVRTRRFVAIKRKESDTVVAAFRQGQEEELLLVSRKGMAIRFALQEVPTTGRATAGVKAMALSEGDEVFSVLPYTDIGELLLSTDSGQMKRCILADFDPQARGGKGVRCMPFAKNGANGTCLVAAIPVYTPVEFLCLQQQGQSTSLHTDMIEIQLKSGKGTPMLMAQSGDLLEKVLLLSPSQP